MREIRCHLRLQHVLVVTLKILAITVLILLLVDVEANHEEAYAVDQDYKILKKLCDVSPYLIEFIVGGYMLPIPDLYYIEKDRF